MWASKPGEAEMPDEEPPDQALGEERVSVIEACVHEHVEIVLAATEEPLQRLEAAVAAAEDAEEPSRGLEILLTQIVDLEVGSRAIVSNLQGDPVLVRFLWEHEQFRDLMEREH